MSSAKGSRAREAKSPDRRPARQRYTLSHALEHNRVRRVRRQWARSLRTYLKGPRKSTHPLTGAVRLRRRGLDLQAAATLERLTGRLPAEAAALKEWAE